MIDIENTISNLETNIRWIENTECHQFPGWGNVTMAMRDALELLKEREAVEPIPFFTETGAESPNYVVCGHCKSIKAIMPKHTKQKYCHECGFPVLWKGR